MDEWHILGLANFHRLNVKRVGREIKMTVLYPVHYDTPRRFQDSMERIIVNFRDIFQSIFGAGYAPATVPYTNLRNIRMEFIQCIVKDNEYRLVRNFQVNGVRLLSGGLLLGQAHEFEEYYEWCKSMTDELIGQVYATLNAVNYVHVMYKHNWEGYTDAAVRATLRFQHPIANTCSNFFQINCITHLQLTRPGLDGDEYNGVRNKNQWSGKWGIKMFFESNFAKINEELYEELYPNDVRRSGEYFYYKVPYHSITLEDNWNRSLAIAMMAEAKLKANPLLHQPYQREVGEKKELMAIIKRLSFYQESPQSHTPPYYLSRDLSPPPYDGSPSASPPLTPPSPRTPL